MGDPLQDWLRRLDDEPDDLETTPTDIRALRELLEELELRRREDGSA